MTITKLIAKLEEVRGKDGDLPVKIYIGRERYEGSITGPIFVLRHVVDGDRYP